MYTCIRPCSFLRSPGDFLEVLSCTIGDGGGDADSTAALSCCLAGAYLGERGIPDVLKSDLQDQGAYRTVDLRELCLRLA